MSLKEDLLAAGLEESQASIAEGVLKAHIAGEFIPKHRFDEVNSKVKEISKELIQAESERDEAVKAREKAEKEVSPLKEKLDEVQKEWEAKYHGLEEQHAQEEQDRQTYQTYMEKLGWFKNAIGDTAYDTDMVISLLDMDSVTADGDAVKQAIEAVKKERPYLFKSEEPVLPTAPTSGHGQPKGTNFGELLAKKAQKMDAMTAAATEKYFGNK